MFKLFVHVDERSCYSSHTTSSTSGNFRSRPSVSFAIPSFDDDCFTMAKGRRPPPLNLSIDARPRSLPRISRTPANKEATPLLTPLPEDDYEDPPEPIVRAVRIAVDFMHLVACMMLVLMMAIFLVTSSQPMTSSYGTKALLLLIALAGDVVLDMRSINLHDRSWSDWALAARSLSSSVYLGVLISFLAAERVFPVDYTYWNLVPEEAGEPVLALLCVVLGWDIVHLILSQRRAGWWWTWARAQWQRGPSKIGGGGGVMGGWDRNRGGRAPRRTMRGWTWSCAS
ncbi:hypothetical protein B0J13DRAFT_30764 [Dactylonectria estremocensis]|uniref:Uncharacterized protein n=1 Tax=Dactylonectria estremocensis TaxID=1079267 RepID=A0A9P9JF03_9HYPO|nr:hypothetical protein B0J13DRAFT_30764 [Dactylonectria estremocensis]